MNIRVTEVGRRATVEVWEESDGVNPPAVFQLTIDREIGRHGWPEFSVELRAGTSDEFSASDDDAPSLPRDAARPSLLGGRQRPGGRAVVIEPTREQKAVIERLSLEHGSVAVEPEPTGWGSLLPGAVVVSSGGEAWALSRTGRCIGRYSPVRNEQGAAEATPSRKGDVLSSDNREGA